MTKEEAEAYKQGFEDAEKPIRDWLERNDHDLTPGETIIEKLDNMQSIIDSQRDLLDRRDPIVLHKIRRDFEETRKGDADGGIQESES